jgi:hypothetical protein
MTRKEDLIPVYRFMDNFLPLYDSVTDEEIKSLLLEMRDTILYQMQEIRKQRAENIYIKHKYSWRRYDKSMEDYDPTTRKYKSNENVNDISKPNKSSESNPSC